MTQRDKPSPPISTRRAAVTTDTSTSTVESIDAEMLRSMAASFRSGLGFSFNGQDMAEVLDRARARLTLPDDAALDALVKGAEVAARVMKSMSSFETGQGILLEAAAAITALRAQNAALQAQVTALAGKETS